MYKFDSLLNIILGTEKRQRQVVVSIILLILIIPFTFLSTTSYGDNSLVEVRIRISEFQNDVMNRVHRMKVNYIVFTHIDTILGIDRDFDILELYHNRLKNFNIEILSVELFSQRSDTLIQKVLDLNYRNLIIFDIASPNTFNSFKILTMRIKIQYPEETQFFATDSYRFIPKNFIMIPELSTVFARNTGITYISDTYTSPESKPIPGIPFISTQYEKHDANNYSNFFIALVILLIITRILIWKSSAKHHLRKAISLYPNQY